MALEQLVAFLNDIPQASLGAPSFTGPDMFPLLDSSDLCTEHKLLSELFDEVIASGELGYFDLQHYAAGTHILESSPESMGRFALACVERSFAVESHLCGDTVLSWDQRQFLEFGTADTFRTLLRRNAEVDPAYSVTLTRWLAATPVNKPAWVYTTVLGLLKRQFTPESLPDDLRNVLIEIWAPVKLHGGFGFGKSVREFIGDGPWDFVLPVDPFADVAVTDLLAMDRKLRDAWQVLLAHCKTATSSKPTTKWSKLTDELLVAVGAKNFRDSVGRWFPHVGRPRPGRKVYRRDEHAELLHAQNSLVLRGLLWTCTLCADRNLCRSLGEVAKAAYQKIPGIGPRDLKAGNAAVYALGQIGTLDSVAALAVLKTRVKLLNAQKGIEKALTATAERVGIPREELEEMSVPDYGLTDVGVRSETLGEFTAELRVAGRKSELHWFKPDGTEQKTVPKSLKDDFGDELKEFKQAARDIEKMIPAQAARIEQTYLQQKEWSFPIWADRYLNHPLVGTLTRRLIWKLQRGRNHATAIWADDGLVDQRGKTVNWADEKTTVRLWHPLDESDTSQVTAWRDWLIDHEVRQPFKQAHREIYILTDAERNTDVYSNRFAAHVLKQHQFNALCLTRGWKNKLRLLVDDEYPPAHLELSSWNLRAEYWIEGAGDDFGTDTNESGTFLYLITDQVRFYRTDAATNRAHAGGGGYGSSGIDRNENQPLHLDEIPALVFSEVMRDVDLFVGVASVGNDPSWADGGPEDRYQNYWQSYSFGELNATASTRKALLECLIPRLKIADRCTFSDRFLVVQGDIRTYRIHLGSGNIRMEPNDEYLCIVPKQSTTKGADGIFLPFEGDGTLSIILSKALLLAEDSKIKDSTIVSQIKR